MPESNTNFTPYISDDMYLNMELVKSRDGDEPDFAKVMKCLRDKDGMPIGRSHNNPILDTRMYDAEYKDEQKTSLTVNAITENMFDLVIFH